MSAEAHRLLLTHLPIPIEMYGLLSLIADCHDEETGRCNPSTWWLTEQLICSRSMVLRRMKLAIENGIITREEWETGSHEAPNMKFLPKEEKK